MTEILKELSNFFNALSDPTRFRLIRLLMFNDEDKLKVIDLAEKIGISQPAITQHINILKKINLIKSNTEQNRKYYFINKRSFKSYKNLVNRMLDISFMRCKMNVKCEDCPMNCMHK